MPDAAGFLLAEEVGRDDLAIGAFQNTLLGEGRMFLAPMEAKNPATAEFVEVINGRAEVK